MYASFVHLRVTCLVFTLSGLSSDLWGETLCPLTLNNHSGCCDAQNLAGNLGKMRQLWCVARPPHQWTAETGRPWFLLSLWFLGWSDSDSLDFSNALLRSSFSATPFRPFPSDATVRVVEVLLVLCGSSLTCVGASSSVNDGRLV